LKGEKRGLLEKRDQEETIEEKATTTCRNGERASGGVPRNIKGRLLGEEKKGHIPKDMVGTTRTEDAIRT